jgi:dolichol-phosphate mannosyltransferase
MSISIIVPTYNEAGNVQELVRRIAAATSTLGAELIFVDDSTDETPAVISKAAAQSAMPIRLIHRDVPVGGLGGAVVSGITAAQNDWVLVMDGDLQHPPEMIPTLAATALGGTAALVVASRYRKDGDAGGLSSLSRRAVSGVSTLLTRAMFPSRLRDCTDPMTGFFMVRRSGISMEALEPRGFKILLEIIARQPKRVEIVEEPFVFGERHAGDSKASFTQGFRFLHQLIALKFGRMGPFALIGLLGAIANVAIVALLTMLGVGYITSAIIAAEVTIISNFYLQERFVFGDLAKGAGAARARFLKSFIFNNAEAALRLPILFVLVDIWAVAAVPATAFTLVVAFVGRFIFHSRVIYAPKSTKSTRISPALDGLNDSESPVPNTDVGTGK